MRKVSLVVFGFEGVEPSVSGKVVYEDNVVFEVVY